MIANRQMIKEDVESSRNGNFNGSKTIFDQMFMAQTAIYAINAW